MGGGSDSEVIAAITSFLDERGLRIVPASAVLNPYDNHRAARSYRRRSGGADIPVAAAAASRATTTEAYSQSASEPEAINAPQSFSYTDQQQHQQQQSEFEGLFMMGSCFFS